MDITSLPLQAPNSPKVVYELLGAYEKIPMRVLAAALGVCCPSLKLKAVFAGDVSKYGQAVFDELVKRGVPTAQIFARGSEAFGLASQLIERLPTGQEVDVREGFTEAAALSTTS